MSGDDRPAIVRRAVMSLFLGLAGALPSGVAMAQAHLGTISGSVGGEPGAWSVFDGDFMGMNRAMATVRHMDVSGGQIHMIQIEGAPGAPPPGAEGAGMVALQLELRLPGGAAGPGDAEIVAIELHHVADWPEGRAEPETVFFATDGLHATLDRLELGEGAMHVALSVQGEICGYEVALMETGLPEPSSDCLRADLTFDTALHPWERPQPTATPPATAAAPQPSAPPPSDDPVTLTVLGSVSAVLDGQVREWLTIGGDIDGDSEASATWQHNRFNVPGMADIATQMMEMTGGSMSEEEQRRLQQMAEALGQIADMPGLATGGFVSLTISGHDPASANILREEVLSITLTLHDIGDPAALTGRPLSAEIAYYEEFSGGLIPDVFHISGEDGREASVTFETLELTPGGGHAAGRFEASLCRMEGARLTEGADLDACMSVEGRFDTALVEEDPFEF